MAHTEDKRREAEQRAEEVYRLTSDASTLNSLIQAASGIIGSGANWVADLGVIPLYIDLWNNIRQVYGKGSITREAATAYLKPNLPYIVADLLVDKIASTFLPIIGVPINYTYAKALTWRLGAFFGMISALGEEAHTYGDLSRMSARVVAELFPLEELSLLKTLTFRYKNPDKTSFIEILSGLDGISLEDAQKRIEVARDVLSGKRGAD